jgi:hypothetical protein
MRKVAGTEKKYPGCCFRQASGIVSRMKVGSTVRRNSQRTEKKPGELSKFARLFQIQATESGLLSGIQEN